MLPIQKKITTRNFYKGNTPKYIVIHYTATAGAPAKNHVDYICREATHGSAHYFVDDSNIWQCIEDNNGAWHVGDGDGKYGITNKNSIGIEMCVDKNMNVTAKTEENTLELVKYLMKKHNIAADKVVRHYDASRKQCPNWSANGWERWTKFKKKLTSTSSSTSTTTSSSKPTSYKKYGDYVGDRCAELQTKLNKLGYDCGKVDGSFGPATYEALIKFQKENKLDPDGYAGPKTFAKLDELIKKKEEAAKKPVSNVSTKAKFKVVAGTYSSRANAEDLQKKLKAKGFDSFISIYDNSSKKLYRVIAGSYNTRAYAEEGQKQLKAKGFESFILAV